MDLLGKIKTYRNVLMIHQANLPPPPNIPNIPDKYTGISFILPTDIILFSTTI
jgi:hypothetical protein